MTSKHVAAIILYFPSFLVCRELLMHLFTLGRNPLDERSAQRRDLYLTTHNTHNRQTSMPRWESNPLSQQMGGRRPTPQATWLMRSSPIFVCVKTGIRSSYEGVIWSRAQN